MENHKAHVPNHQPGDIMGDINEIFTGSFYIPSVDGIPHNLSLNSDAMAEVLITTPPKKNGTSIVSPDMVDENHWENKNIS